MLLIKNGYCINSEKEGYFDILVDGDRIAKIDKNIEGSFDEVIDAKDCIVMPTFCNAHTHLAMSLFRGLADDLELMDWLNNHIFPAEAKYVNKDMVYICSKLSMLEGIRSATGCFYDMYFFEEEVAKAAIEIGVRTIIGEGIIDFPTPDCKTPKDAIEKTKSLKREFKDSNLIKVSYAPHSTYTLSEDTLKMVADALDDNDIVQIHINESKREVELVKSQKGKRPLEVLNDTGLLTDRTFMAHCVETDDEEIDLIKEKNAKVINVPQSNFKLASGIAPICKMVKKGIDVYIGTDGPASNNNLDMIEEIRTSSLVQKVKFGEKAMSSKTILKLASNFDGLFDGAGYLKEGNFADIAIISLDGIESVPIYNPYSFIAYALNSRDVRDVIVSGRIILKNREFVDIDEEEVKFKVRELSKSLGGL